MKTKSTGRLLLTCAALFLSPTLFAQTNLNFTKISATVEGAIQLSWQSTSNEVYRIEYADELVDSNGLTSWLPLYNEYPSHGTNTFWLDTGNYRGDPVVLHPKKMPTRFYRIVNDAPDSNSNKPTVLITSPTNGQSLSGEATVVVFSYTDQATLSSKLFVDGEEMFSSVDSTNYSDGGTNFLIETYILKTCEWPNGSHTIFATAKCASDISGPYNGSTILTAHSVSPYVPVSFDNLITRFSFSEPSFNPDAGQTQQVSAVFTANCNWTLEVQDESTNTVRSQTGSGSSMLFNWDGKGTNGISLPAGIYTYLLSVQTNGQQMMMVGANSGASLPSASEIQETSQLWFLQEQSYPVPLQLLPSDFDTNGLTIFAATQSEIDSLVEAVEFSDQSKTLLGAGSLMNVEGDGEMFNSAFAGSGQSARGSGRPPTNPIKGVVGLIAVAVQDYLPEMLSMLPPRNGLPTQQRVALQGSTGAGNLPFYETHEEDEFLETMARGAWGKGFFKKNTQLKASDLRSAAANGSNAFNTNGACLGLLSLHGAYGTAADYTANQAFQIYFPVDGRPGTSEWVRMSEMDFGSSGTNGLKWMVLHACNSLREQNWNSLRTAGFTPFNRNLHLLLGANSIVDNGNEKVWAKFMLGLDGQAKRPILNAWQDSSRYCAHSPVEFAVAGYTDCKLDMLSGTNNITPSGSVFYQVLPTPP